MAQLRWSKAGERLEVPMQPMAATPRPDAVEIALVEDQPDVVVLTTEVLAQARIVSRTVARGAAVAPTPSAVGVPAAGGR